MLQYYWPLLAVTTATFVAPSKPYNVDIRGALFCFAQASTVRRVWRLVDSVQPVAPVEEEGEWKKIFSSGPTTVL
jgi:hypothetical protein